MDTGKAVPFDPGSSSWGPIPESAFRAPDARGQWSFRGDVCSKRDHEWWTVVWDGQRAEPAAGGPRRTGNRCTAYHHHNPWRWIRAHEPGPGPALSGDSKCGHGSTARHGCYRWHGGCPCPFYFFYAISSWPPVPLAQCPPCRLSSSTSTVRCICSHRGLQRLPRTRSSPKVCSGGSWLPLERPPCSRRPRPMLPPTQAPWAMQPCLGRCRPPWSCSRPSRCSTPMSQTGQSHVRPPAPVSRRSRPPHQGPSLSACGPRQVAAAAGGLENRPGALRTWEW